MNNKDKMVLVYHITTNTLKFQTIESVEILLQFLLGVSPERKRANRKKHRKFSCLIIRYRNSVMCYCPIESQTNRSPPNTLDFLVDPMEKEANPKWMF